MIELEAIQVKITEHEGQCSKIDEQAKSLIEKAKAIQKNLTEIQTSLNQLNNMKIARIAAIQELKSLLSTDTPTPVEPAPVPAEPAAEPEQEK